MCLIHTESGVQTCGEGVEIPIKFLRLDSNSLLGLSWVRAVISWGTFVPIFLGSERIKKGNILICKPF